LATWRQLGFWSANRADGHQNDLVSIEGQVVTWVREATQDEYVLDSDGRLFTAIYHHPPEPGEIPPMRQIPLGSRIRVTGICFIESSDQINPGEEVPFNILLRSFDDITVVARPSLLNIRNLLFIVGLLLLVVVGAGVRAWTLERKVRRQTAALADIEQRRGRILEDINGSRPWLRSSRRLRSWSPSRWMALRAGARSPMERGWETVRRSSPACALSKKRFPLVPGRRWARSLPRSTRSPSPGPTNRKPSPWGGTGHAGHRNPKALLRPLAPFGV